MAPDVRQCLRSALHWLSFASAMAVKRLQCLPLCGVLLVLAVSWSVSPAAVPGGRVLVTGGNKGIGRALCRQLAADHGFYVLLGSRDAQRGGEFVPQLDSTGWQ